MRKCKKFEENIQKGKLLKAYLGEGSDVFKEIKTMRKTKQVVASTMDGEKEDIAGHFGQIYSTLYNSAEDEDEMERIKLKIENSINKDSIEDVDKVTADLVKKALSSDCFKTEMKFSLRDSLNSSGASWYMGMSLKALLRSTLVLLVKDPITSINISKNYRSVCLSSLTVKLLDWID